MDPSPLNQISTKIVHYAFEPISTMLYITQRKLEFESASANIPTLATSYVSDTISSFPIANVVYHSHTVFVYVAFLAASFALPPLIHMIYVSMATLTTVIKSSL